MEFVIFKSLHLLQSNFKILIILSKYIPSIILGRGFFCLCEGNAGVYIWIVHALIYVFAVDWIIADILAIRQNALGHVRYVLKDGLKWLPLYGCYFSQVTFSILFHISVPYKNFRFRKLTCT